jgi:hypothetical protein
MAGIRRSNFRTLRFLISRFSPDYSEPCVLFHAPALALCAFFNWHLNGSEAQIASMLKWLEIG